jgi:sugar phosphate isomerase/epimerase
MLKLSAFADEISPDLDEQIRVCLANDVTHFELRGVDGRNVLDFDPDLCRQIKQKLTDNDLGVISIGSPIGKVAIDQPWDAQFHRFKRAVELAEFFQSPLIRVFSYYPPGGEGKGDLDSIRDEVIRRFQQKVQYIHDRPVTMVHENEKGIFGDIARRCLDLMQSVNSPKLRSAFDFANFVQVKEHPLENWALLKSFVTHIHIKDARLSDGGVVPAGQGDGQLAPIIKDAYESGYRGFLSLEPHLKVAGHSHGETGPELFKTAADALKDLCRKIAVPLAQSK